jgi:predicted Zn-dependent protease
MSMMLTFTDHSWATACDLAQAGRRSEAHAALKALLALPNLSPSFAAKAHRLAGSLLCEAGRYAKARQHLRAAVRLEPGNADTRIRLAAAFESDPYGCDRRAAAWYRKAVRHDPANAVIRAAYGRSLVRNGADQLALRQLRRALFLAPTDVTVLASVLEACREMGKPRIGWKVVCRALFLAPTDRAIRQLWQRAKFDMAAGSQRKSVRRVLPFVRLFDGSTVRLDNPSSIPAPHFMGLRVRG